MQLPITIEELIQENQIETVQKDTVIEELKQKSPDTLKALYLLAFQTYEGFEKLL
jgi:type II restriction enzyme